MTRITAITICRQGASRWDSSLDGRSPWRLWDTCRRQVLRENSYDCKGEM